MPKPIALSKNRIATYVMLDNRTDPEEDQIVWQLRAVPFTVRMDIFNSIAIDTAAGSTDARADVGRRFKLSCKHGIAGWSGNLTDSDGASLEWTAGGKAFGVEVIHDECLAQLPDDVVTELGNEIAKLSTSEAHTVGK